MSGTETIRETVERVLEAPVAEDWCGTFTDPGDADRWVQVTHDMVNFAYPRDADPSAFVAGLGRGELVSWEAHKFATLKFRDAVSAASVTAVVEAIFEQVLGRAERSSLVEVKLERLT